MKNFSVFLVGGTFNTEGGRPSGYFGKLADALCAALPKATFQVLNGGSYDQFRESVEVADGVSHLLWFADVPNDLPKLIPVLKERNPGLVLVSSKNNRRKLYSREALFERMRKSRSELLVEFGEDVDGMLVASILASHGEVLLESFRHISNVAQGLAARFEYMASLRFPLNKARQLTADAESFKHRDTAIEAEVPVATHPGAFGVVRKNHIHEGVDLYGRLGDSVYAMESGTVVARGPFTGPAAGSPWWQDTECILIEGASGVFNYGELEVRPQLKVGDKVRAGERLGFLATVLRKDKGRPTTMLHLERYTLGTREPVREWGLGAAQPENLCDPTTLLIQANSRKRVCIVGERGVVSQELRVRLEEDGRYDVSVISTDSVLTGELGSDVLEADLVALCTLEFSSPQVFAKLPADKRVLDVSPAFRTDAGWVYGLSELPDGRERVSKASRVANPGCFATSAILILAPAVRAGLLAPDAPVYLDGAGGYTTGGVHMIEKAANGDLATEAAYSLTKEHRHVAEIKHCTGLTGPVLFTPKIAEVPRGIRMQVALFGVTREQALRLYRAAYDGTEVLVEDGGPSRITVDDWANRRGACLRIYEQQDSCLIVCTLDNLGKGAVDSAFHNIALMLAQGSTE
jgi:N-acetyl-gamma-glutamylphosphate reductase/murein DD-endopeptidase MepM/ murein hydrolase activator NlpD